MPQLHQKEDARNATADGSVMPEAVLQQAQTWSKAQCELLSGIEAIWSRLLQWQREAIEASTRSLAHISESRDLGNVFQIQQQWFEGAVRRTTSNLSELATDAATLPWRVARLDRTAERQSPAATMGRQRSEDHTQLHHEAAK